MKMTDSKGTDWPGRHLPISHGFWLWRAHAMLGDFGFLSLSWGIPAVTPAVLKRRESQGGVWALAVFPTLFPRLPCGLALGLGYGQVQLLALWKVGWAGALPPCC